MKKHWHREKIIIRGWLYGLQVCPVPEKPPEEEAAEETDGEDADQAEETSKEETE